VDVAEDVETGLYAPNFTEEIAVPETEIKMMFLTVCKLKSCHIRTVEAYRRAMGDKNIGLRRYLAQPRVFILSILEAKSIISVSYHGIAGSFIDLRKLLGTNAWNIRNTKDIDGSTLYLLHSQTALKIMKTLHVGLST
jgi:hypothetical protein